MKTSEKKPQGGVIVTQNGRLVEPRRGGWSLVALGLLAAGLISHAWAQFAVNWHTFDGGGGTSTGGGFSISGTIGQSDAGPAMTNGQFAVTGGFWALPVAVQTDGAPTLKIVFTGTGQATVSWSPNTAGFVLQEAGSFAPAGWTNSLSGATNPVIVTLTQPVKFYRLLKQ